MIFKTKKDVMLTLQRVNSQALLDFLVGMGLSEYQNADDVPEYVEFNKSEEIEQGNAMLTYCLGWGVLESPDASALATLKILKKETGLPEIARANWLRYLVLDEGEMSEVVNHIMTISLTKETE